MEIYVIIDNTLITSVNVSEFYKIFNIQVQLLGGTFQYAADEFYLKVCFSDHSR